MFGLQSQTSGESQRLFYYSSLGVANPELRGLTTYLFYIDFFLKLFIVATIENARKKSPNKI
jgi:hypothetical protein